MKYSEEFGRKQYDIEMVSTILEMRKNASKEHFQLYGAAQSILHVISTGRTTGSKEILLRNIKGAKAFNLINKVSLEIGKQEKYDETKAALKIIANL